MTRTPPGSPSEANSRWSAAGSSTTLAADAGVAEREQQLAESQTEVVADLLEKVVGSLDLTSEQREELGPSIRRHLSLVEDDTPDV